jgi:hypothetical protein
MNKYKIKPSIDRNLFRKRLKVGQEMRLSLVGVMIIILLYGIVDALENNDAQPITVEETHYEQ